MIEAAAGYRAAFRPSADLVRPHLSVSADVGYWPLNGSTVKNPKQPSDLG